MGSVGEFWEPQEVVWVAADLWSCALQCEGSTALWAEQLMSEGSAGEPGSLHSFNSSLA